MDICRIERDRAGVLFYDGKYVETLSPGLYAFWRSTADAKVVEFDLRETMLDMAGQELMTADKVTLRLNAVITYRIADARKAASVADDVRQALYREAQLALRARSRRGISISSSATRTRWRRKWKRRFDAV